MSTTTDTTLTRLQSHRAPLSELLALLTEINAIPAAVDIPPAALQALRQAAAAAGEAKQSVVAARRAVRSAQSKLDRLADQSADDPAMQAAAGLVQQAERDVTIAESRYRAADTAQRRAATNARAATHAHRDEEYRRAQLLRAELARDPIGNGASTVGHLVMLIDQTRSSIALTGVVALTNGDNFRQFLDDQIEAELAQPLPAETEPTAAQFAFADEED